MVEILFWETPSGNSPVEKWLDKLKKKDLEAFLSVYALLEKLEEQGRLLRMPFVRNLNQGLFELREADFGLRIYYTWKDQTLVLMLASGGKDSQQRDIKIARKRLKGVK